MPSSSCLALSSSPPARTVGPQCQGIAGLAWKWGLWVGGRSPSGQVSQCLSGWPQAPTTGQSQGQWDPDAVPGPVLGMLGAQAPDLGSRVLGCSAVCLAPSRAGSALNAALYSVPWLLEEGPEMLGGGPRPPQGAPARLVCILGEWDVRLLSVSLLQGTSVLSVPPVPAMSGAWGWVWWVPAPLGVPCPQEPTLRAGGAWHSCVAAVLSGCLAVSLSARSDLSFSLFSPLPHCSCSPRTSSPSSSLPHLLLSSSSFPSSLLLHLLPPLFVVISFRLHLPPLFVYSVPCLCLFLSPSH